MSQGFGHNSFVGFGVESTWGTAVASTKFLEIQKENFKADFGHRMSKPSLRGVSQAHRTKSKTKVEGGFEFQVPTDGAELLFKNLLGANTTTGAGPYTHTMTGAAAMLTGLTFNVCRDPAIAASSGFAYAGCQISKLTLKQAIEDFLIANIEVVGKTQSFIANETATYPTFSGFDWEGFALTVNSASQQPESFDFSYDNGLAADRYQLGQLTRKGLGRGSQRKITCGFTQEFASLTEYNLFLNLTNIAVVATWTKGTSSLALSMPACEITNAAPEVSDAGPVKAKFEFEAYKNSAEGDECGLVLVNSVSSIA
jgi:hypothetical protein